MYPAIFTFVPAIISNNGDACPVRVSNPRSIRQSTSANPSRSGAGPSAAGAAVAFGRATCTFSGAGALSTGTMRCPHDPNTSPNPLSHSRRRISLF